MNWSKIIGKRISVQQFVPYVHVPLQCTCTRGIQARLFYLLNKIVSVDTVYGMTSSIRVGVLEL